MDRFAEICRLDLISRQGPFEQFPGLLLHGSPIAGGTQAEAAFGDFGKPANCDACHSPYFMMSMIALQSGLSFHLRPVRVLYSVTGCQISEIGNYFRRQPLFEQGIQEGGRTAALSLRPH
jgi:hypothetical protein